jgi:hypothetical protein
MPAGLTARVHRHRGRGDNLNHGQNGLARNLVPITDRFADHDHDGGN